MRVPMLARWPGHIPPGRELNGIQAHEDVFVTLAAASGIPDIKERLAQGDTLDTDVTHRCSIDGVNNLAYWTGTRETSARDSFIYYAEATIQAVRWRQWKLHFATRDGYYGTTTATELPLFFNLRQDPFESYDQAPGPRAELSQHKTYLGAAVMSVIQAHLATLREYPPRQRAATLNVAKVIEAMMWSTGGRR